VDRGIAIHRSCDAEGDVDAWIPAVAQVIPAINLSYKNVFLGEPVGGPLVNESEGISAVLETAILTINGSAEVEFVFLPKMSAVAVVGYEADTLVVDVLYPLSQLSLLGMRRNGAS
jgi:hypothetical protein